MPSVGLISKVIFIIVGFLSLIALGSIGYLAIKNLSASNNNKVELLSPLPNYSLNKGPGYDSLVKLIQNRGIFEKGIYINKDSKFYPVRRVRIILNPTELNNLAIKYPDSSGRLFTVASVDYVLSEESTLELRIYVVNSNKGLKDGNNGNKIFNQELIRLVYFATAPFSPTNSKVRIFSADEADSIFNQNYTNNLPVTIKQK